MSHPPCASVCCRGPGRGLSVRQVGTRDDDAFRRVQVWEKLGCIMLLWVILAAMTAASVAAVLHPLRRLDAEAASADAPLVAVYRDQLAEVDAEFERGLISADEAVAARLEIQRRLLKQTGGSKADAAAGGGPATTRWAKLVLVTLVPVSSIALYVALGSPGAPDQPLSVRRAAAPEKAQIEILIARVEEELRSNPRDGRGWEVLAPVYARLGREQDALDAWRHAIRLMGETPPRLRGLVEAALAAGQGTVDAEARGALEKLTAADPADPIPRFWLAIAKQQNGQREEAARDLAALLATAPADAPWRTAVEEQLTALKQTQPSPQSGPDRAAQSADGVGPRATPGPSAEQMAAAAQMPPEDRARMIAGMVEGLAARLERDGGDAEDWLRLINAYNVLGRKADAALAMARARDALAGNGPALERLASLSRQLGL